jgi:hypothetical protein
MNNLTRRDIMSFDEQNLSFIVDATKPVTVIIGDEDRDATRRSPSRCVVANRVMRMPGVVDVRVGASSIRILHDDGWRRYDLDPNTMAAIRAYDEAGEMMPPGFRVIFTPPARPIGSREGETSGSDRRSGAGTHVATRRPSTRNIFLEPEAHHE